MKNWVQHWRRQQPIRLHLFLAGLAQASPKGTLWASAGVK